MPVTKPSKIVLAPTEGGTIEEGSRQRSNRGTIRGRYRDVADEPGDGGLEVVGDMTATGRQDSI